MENKVYLNWLDVCKGLTMLLVIVGHCLPYELRVYIFSFHMPLFFILSGYTIKETNSIKDLFNSTLKDLRRLLVPTVIVMIIEMVYNIMISNHSLKTGGMIFLKSLMYGDSKLGENYVGFMWFTFALLITKLAYRVVSMIIKNNRFTFLLIIAVICGYLFNGIILPYHIDTLFLFMLYLEFGHIISRYSYLEENNKYNVWITGVILFIYLL